MFGANVLSAELLRRKEITGRFMFVETGDFRLRSRDFANLLRERQAIHVPLAEEDVLEDLQIVEPLGFPVDEPFRSTLAAAAEATNRPARIGFAGRLHEAKGLLGLIEATRQVRATGRSVSLEIVGDGPERAALGEVADRLGWLNVREGIEDAAALREYYEGLAVYVVASTPAANEGLPVSMLEALLCGARVVATDVGAIRARVGDLVTLVPPGESRSMAEGIITALGSSPDHDEVRSRIPTPHEYAKRLLDALGDSVAGHPA
jgi:glycosyltransferase involved in cell wall biosynthesis